MQAHSLQQPEDEDRCWDLIRQLRMQRSLELEHFANVRNIMQRGYFATLTENEALQARVSGLEAQVARQRKRSLLARACCAAAGGASTAVAAPRMVSDALRSVGSCAGARASQWLWAACDRLLKAPPTNVWVAGAQTGGVHAFECGRSEWMHMTE